LDLELRGVHRVNILEGVMAFMVGCIAGIFLVALVEILSDTTYGDAMAEMQAAAIEHGCAQYDTTTGEWGWKE